MRPIAHLRIAVRRTATLFVLGLLVAAVAPAASQAAVTGRSITATAGQPFSGIVADFSDANSAPPSMYSATIDWGDGTAPTPGTISCECAPGPAPYHVSGTHTYAQPGTYTITIVLSANQVPQGTATGSAQVAPPPSSPPPGNPPPNEPPPPAATPGAPAGTSFSPTVGKAWTGDVATVPAPGPADSYTAKVTWGDGTVTPGTVSGGGGTLTISGTHTYAIPGPHQVLVEVDPKGGAPGSVGSANAFVRSANPPASCQTHVTVAPFALVADCLREESPGRWVSRGGVVRVNGLDLTPLSPKGAIELVVTGGHRALRSLSTNLFVVSAGPIPLTAGQIRWAADVKLLDVPTFGHGAKVEPIKVAHFDLGDAAALFGFKLTGAVDVDLVGQRTNIGVVVALPKLFGDITGGVGLQLSNKEGLVLDALDIRVTDALLGGLQVKDLFVSYRRVGMEWRGGADLILPSGTKIHAVPTADRPLDGFRFADGEFKNAGAQLEFADPGIAVYPPVYLNTIGFAVGTDPTRFIGEARFSAGKALGKALATGTGTIVLAFATSGAPYEADIGFPATHRTFRSTTLEISADVDVLGLLSIKGYVLYSYPAYLELAGHYDGSFIDGWVSAQATIGGAVDMKSGLFDAEAGANVCVRHIGCTDGDVIVSSKGAGGCVRTFLADVGGGFYWSGGVFFMWHGCDVAPYIRVAVPASVRGVTGARAAAARTFTVAPGQRGVAFGAVGRDAPPRVALVGPRGERIEMPADPDASINNHQVLAFRSERDNTAYVILGTPSPGQWHVEEMPGSVPVTELRQAAVLPKPRVIARVTGRGHHRVLHYAVKPIPGQRVTFVERGNAVMRRIGVARGARGKIAFAPADSARGRRSIVALVESYGTARASLKVAGYNAPDRVRSPAPRALRLHVAGGRACATWARQRGALRWAARFRLAGGARLLVVTPAHTTRACVGGLHRGERVTAAVTALRADNFAGRAARASAGPRHRRKRGRG